MAEKDDFPIFISPGEEDAAEWVKKVDKHFEEEAIPDEEHLQFALDNLSEKVNACIMRSELTRILESISKTWVWTWPKLRVALTEIDTQVKQTGLSKANIAAKVVTVAVVTGVSCVAGPAILTAGLGAIGFSAAGPVAGSIAAGIQSSVYGGAVGAGSLFAFCQSLTMGGGAAMALATGISGASGAAAGIISEIAKRPSSKSWDDAKDFKPSVTVIKALLRFDDQK
ncbi:uncharacterized protein FOMMEDRAFT_170768 [Fomitiporia mediterranea MF3/22]|uniref:uncharacterized protein n=1 Tax=Fomitiporia mediterranea (strain MF3/22) TaxID=694068 RepID=UPI0004408746|nr:uncharacterized protein FOMMEDRAFT_170768 [Fomitiporia mediterranea MF3/22]EJC98984.1 hypothetical protein FOMMEDRAFT_170768 [Fomitiporia mediterranea MF3/22]